MQFADVLILADKKKEGKGRGKGGGGGGWGIRGGGEINRKEKSLSIIQ